MEMVVQVGIRSTLSFRCEKATKSVREAFGQIFIALNINQNDR